MDYITIYQLYILLLYKRGDHPCLNIGADVPCFCLLLSTHGSYSIETARSFIHLKVALINISGALSMLEKIV